MQNQDMKDFPGYQNTYNKKEIKLYNNTTNGGLLLE